MSDARKMKVATKLALSYGLLVGLIAVVAIVCALRFEGINARIGCSLGVATYPVDARSKEALIRLADERMYKDKDNRR